MGILVTCCCKNDEEADTPSNSTSLTEEINKKSFKILKVLGEGNFGKVYLVEKNNTKELYAMKILEKQLIEEKKQRTHTIAERKILENTRCPFITKLHYAFQTPSKLYMVMEYLNGGELFFHLSQQRTFSEIRTKFYIGEILIGLQYLHSHGIIYRDLKPENVLLDHEGHIRLTDFGLSKDGIDEDNPKAFTFCGTAEYLAPEVIRGFAYDKAVDFWSLGAIMYYMLSGAPPFYSKNSSEIFRNVISRPVQPVQNITNNGNDLLLNLLKIDVKHI